MSLWHCQYLGSTRLAVSVLCLRGQKAHRLVFWPTLSQAFASFLLCNLSFSCSLGPLTVAPRVRVPTSEGSRPQLAVDQALQHAPRFLHSSAAVWQANTGLGCASQTASFLRIAEQNERSGGCRSRCSGHQNAPQGHRSVYRASIVCVYMRLLM
jgi:hypothetical protein